MQKAALERARVAIANAHTAKRLAEAQSAAATAKQDDAERDFQRKLQLAFTGSVTDRELGQVRAHRHAGAADVRASLEQVQMKAEAIAIAEAERHMAEDRDVAKLSEEACATIRSREIGFVFQLPALLPRATALENVELPLVYAGVGRSERHQRTHRLKPEMTASGRRFLAGATSSSMICPSCALDSGTSDGILSLFENLHQDGRTIIPQLPHGIPPREPKSARRNESDLLTPRQCYFSRSP